ncbi:hypothetical protein [Frigoriflavimonas asaccharolytica]|uniref:T9SS C-terminal target domain-containing protein n=1 Tax=Frigoriflavimonas asaccharolytica TaxID=2735899 RepID=A0A8J8G777_9FLAO|nr:hypothetical protein [Frigoriflavimonas asaccharolytica]NRS91242.1 hypothetical protein [Frigoriflavimonas asaccharolytica]
MKYFSIYISLFFTNFYFAQQSHIFKINKYKIAVLSDSLQENSGLTFFKDQLFSINDGGNTSELFQLNAQTGKVIKKHRTYLQNTDWEAITNDNDNFYIGDFGNNNGTRKDLNIYKFPIDSGISVDRTLSVTDGFATSIPFYYPEQTDFRPKNLRNDFDAEAMIFLNGEIHLFTKEWNSKMTTHYLIDSNTFELQAAKKVETFDIGFVVTDASFFDGKLYLIGYTKKTEVFLQIFAVSENVDLFFTKPLQKYYLGSAISLGQIEGIAVNASGIYISAERFLFPFGKTTQKFFHIPHDKLD